MEKVLEEKDASKKSKLKTFMMLVFIPLLFAITVALIVMTILGVNVFKTTKEYGEKIPIISSIFKEDEGNKVKELESQVVDLQAEMSDREARIAQLVTEIDKKNKEISTAQLEKKRLKEEIFELTAMQQENKRSFKDLMKTFETMPAKKAAPILTEMPESEAVKILSNMKTDSLAAVLEKMESKDAARFTELLTTKASQ